MLQGFYPSLCIYECAPAIFRISKHDRAHTLSREGTELTVRTYNEWVRHLGTVAGSIHSR